MLSISFQTKLAEGRGLVPDVSTAVSFVSYTVPALYQEFELCAQQEGRNECQAFRLACCR